MEWTLTVPYNDLGGPGSSSRATPTSPAVILEPVMMNIGIVCPVPATSRGAGAVHRHGAWSSSTR